jgi:hypothetical protein
MISNVVRIGQLNLVVKALELARIGVRVVYVLISAEYRRRGKERQEAWRLRRSQLESEESAASVWIVSCHEHGHINSY